MGWRQLTAPRGTVGVYSDVMINLIKIIYLIWLGQIFTSILSIFCLSNTAIAANIDNHTHVKFHCEIINPIECLAIAGLSRDLIEDTTLIKPGIDAIVYQLAYIGYPLARVDSIVKQQSSGKYNVNVYFSIGTSLLLNDTKYSEQVFEVESKIGLEKSSIVSSNIVKDEAIRLLDYYADNGFPFAIVNVTPTNINYIDNLLFTDLSFNSNFGTYTRIGSVNFPDAIVTSEKLLRKESRIHRGSTFNRSFINRSLSKLNKLPYINQHGPIKLVPVSHGVVDLYIPVSENKVSTFSGIAAYDQEDDKIRGDANLSLGNIFGSGRKLVFIWGGLDPQREGVSIEYYEPWLMGYPVHAIVGINLWSGDLIGVKFDRYFGVDWQPNFNITVGSSVKFESLQLPKPYSADGKFRSIWITFMGSIDYLDRVWNPKKGIYFSTQSSTGIRSNSSSSTTANTDESWTLHRDQIGLHYITKLYQKLLISQRSQIDDIRGDNLTIADLISIGGINSLRGYAEGRNLVKGVYINNFEFRWRVNDDAYFGLFNDIGWVYRKDTHYQTTNLLSSIGLTSGIHSNSTNFYINIGLANGEPIQQTRLHISIQRFF